MGFAEGTLLVGDREAIREGLALLTEHQRRRFRTLTALQCVMAPLDFAGVLLIGVVAVVAVSQAQGTAPPSPIPGVIDALGLSELSPTGMVMVLAGAAVLLLIARSVASLFVTRRLNRFLAECTGGIADRTMSRFLSRSVLSVRERSTQWVGFALTAGLSSIVVSLLGAVAAFWGEVALLVVLSGALLLVDPVLTLLTVGYLAVVSLTMHHYLGRRVARAGRTLNRADVADMTTVTNAMRTHRELAVTGRLDAPRATFAAGRRVAGRAWADKALIQQVPRYVADIALVVGGIVLVIGLLLTTDSETAVGTLAVFLAAGTRILPSLLRLNGARLTISAAAGTGSHAISLLQELPEHPEQPGDVALLPATPGGEALCLEGVSFTYPGAVRPALSGVTLRVDPGTSLAVVGMSGAGKSTLADLVLGVLRPDSGEVFVGGRPAWDRRTSPRGYVPQEVIMIEGTVRDNVALGVPPAEVDDRWVTELLHRVSLLDVVRDRGGLDTQVGEDGLRLSGGQRQRLGVARALYSRPGLLVLDEATSALDAETEVAIAQVLRSLEGGVTTVTIAHRLSTVRDSDQVVYLDSGSAVAVGTFADLRTSVPKFDRQAQLLGL